MPNREARLMPRGGCGLAHKAAQLTKQGGGEGGGGEAAPEGGGDDVDLFADQADSRRYSTIPPKWDFTGVNKLDQIKPLPSSLGNFQNIDYKNNPYHKHPRRVESMER